MTVDALGLHVQRPGWLLALLALPLLAWWWRTRVRRDSAWRDYVDPHLLPHLLASSGQAGRRRSGPVMGLLAAGLAIVALSGPGIRKEAVPAWQSRQPLVIALDLSSHMLARDLPPSRLAQARAKLSQLLRERVGGQVALVAYADDAYTVAPLTDDAANVAVFLDALSPDVMPTDGQRGDRAVAWSRRLLNQAGFARGDILLVTGGADAAANAEAARARAAGITVSVLAVGRNGGGVVDTGASLGHAPFDAAALQRLASSAGGRYAAIRADDGDLRALGVLDPRSGAGEASRGSGAVRWLDQGYWLLPIVMLLALPLFRRVGALALVVGLGCLWPAPPASAQAVGTAWRRADQVEHARTQDGIAAYRRGQFDRAIEQFSANRTPDGQYNLGNALAKAGRYDEAIAAYDRALAQRPGMADAVFNRRLVQAAKRLPKRKDGNGESKPQDGRDGQGAPQAGNGKPRPDPRSRGENAGSPKRAQQPDKDPTPDPQRQAAADAAQRARMEQALRQGGNAAAQPATPRATPETAEQRERRLANEAWLQRIPDDPGALLRSRFQLEQRRRRGDMP